MFFIEHLSVLNTANFKNQKLMHTKIDAKSQYIEIVKFAMQTKNFFTKSLDARECAAISVYRCKQPL